MSTDDYNPLSDLMRMQEEFGDEFPGTEMELHETRLGLHTLYDDDAEDPTIGWKTAFYGVIHEATEEVSIDADTLEIHHGEVSPEAAREELKNQLYDHINWHDLEEEILNEVANHVERRMEHS